MADRQRYWKLSADEVAGLKYSDDKMLNWDVKCTREPHDDAVFVGVYAYKHGIPVEYESVPGIAFYYNRISDSERDALAKLLRSRFGGSVDAMQNRVLLRGADAPYLGADIGALAADLESHFGGTSVVTLEFEGLTLDEQEAAGLPATKLLPVPGRRDTAPP